jgi:hypothetical protein
MHILETISERGAIANSAPICDLYSMAADLEIMQLKVRLLGISPMIWRRVLVEASTSLEELHGMLQVAMGWEGFHLYQFDIRGSMYGSFELGILDPDDTLASLEFRTNDRFAYNYDMGDYWQHDVRVEALISANAKTKYPICVAGNGACPPEECGGPEGFLARRDEADGHHAYEDMEILSDFAAQLLACQESRAGLEELEFDEVQPAMDRMNARVPYMTNKFSRAQVNQNFARERHVEMMHQQLF